MEGEWEVVCRICRMAPFLMTLTDPNHYKYDDDYYYSFEPNYLKMSQPISIFPDW